MYIVFFLTLSRPPWRSAIVEGVNKNSFLKCYFECRCYFEFTEVYNLLRLKMK